MTEVHAKEIYQRDYWNRARGNNIESQAVAENIFDVCFNMVVKSGCRLAQSSLDITPVDGITGNQSLQVINASDEELFLAKFALAKMQRYGDICTADSSQKNIYWAD